MFQFGRSAENPVDFIVMDTIPGAEYISDSFATRSTISRFACRILVDRSPPHMINVYAAGFDTKNRIQLGVSWFFMDIISICLKMQMFLA